MVIELILALLLNILHTAPPDAPPPVVGQSNVVVQDALTLRKLVVVLDEEHGLDILLYILQHIEEHEAYRGWNLTLLEIVYYVLSSQKPAAVFKVGAKETATAKEPTASVVSAESAAAGSTAADADEPATDGMGASTTAAPSPSSGGHLHSCRQAARARARGHRLGHGYGHGRGRGHGHGRGHRHAV